MSRSIFGVRIYTQTSISHDEIGLFNGVFCLSDGEVTSSGPWKYGMVPDNSLGDTDESGDIRDAGNISQSGGFNVVFANAKEKASQILEDEGITLINKRADLVEIDSGSGREYVRAVAVCSEIAWHETDMILGFVDAVNFSDANISKAITAEDYPSVDADFVGNWIPATFGSIDKAKLVSASTGEVALDNEYLTGLRLSPEGETIFPIWSPTSDQPTLTYIIYPGLLHADFILNLTPTFDKSRFIGKFIKPVVGNAVGEYREIVDAKVYTGSNPGNTYPQNKSIQLTIKTFFSKTLRGDSFCTGEEQTWVSIVDIRKKFVVDVAEVSGFLNSSGSLTTTDPNLFAYSNESKSDSDGSTAVVVSKKYDFRSIPNYIASDASAKHNELDFSLSDFKDNPDTIESAVIVTPEECHLIDDRFYANGDAPYLYASKTLKQWITNQNNDQALGIYDFKYPGLYIHRGDTFQNNSWEFDSSTYPASNAIDKDKDTFARVRLKTNFDAGDFTVRLIMGYELSLPKILEEFDFDSVNLLIKGTSSAFQSSWAESFSRKAIYLRYNRWAGYAKEILPSAIGGNIEPTGWNAIVINDMIDSYYGGVDKNLYYHRPSVAQDNGKYSVVSGHTNFQFSDISTIEQYNSIGAVCVLLQLYIDKFRNGMTVNMLLHEVAVAFLKTISIRDKIYCPVNGRIYGGTWGGRKTATSVITNPVDLLEYLDRRKNTAYYLPRRIDWGLEPTPDPLVNTSSDEGGYDWAHLAAPKAQTIAFQAFSEDACSIKALQKKICAEFFLVKYRDGRGRECVNYIGDGIGVANIDKNITLADIPPEAKLGEVEECPHEDIVSSRITLRYKKNYGNDQYSLAITISNIYQPLYRSEYVTGYDGSLKQSLWQRAHYLWQLYGDSTSAKEKVIDLETIRDEATAVWHLQRFLAFQGRRRRNVVVKYDTARKWNLFDHVTLTLPDLNNGNEVEAIIEKKQAVRSRGVTNLGLVLLSGVGMESASWSSNSGSSASDSSSSDSQSAMSGSKSSSSSSWSAYSNSYSSVSSSASSDSSDSISVSSGSDSSDSNSSFSLGNIVNDDLGNLGTAGTIPKFAATGLADSLFTETATGINLSGSLGIGTAELTAGLLNVASARAKTDVTFTRLASFRSNEALASYPLELYIAHLGHATSSSQALSIQAGHYGLDFNATLWLQKDGGSVAVGTSLTIGTIDTLGHKLTVFDNSTAVNSTIGIDQTGTGDAALQFRLTGTIAWRIGIDNSDSDKFKISNSTAGDDFGTDFLTIAADGNVGIGTTAPSSLLDLEKTGTAKAVTDLLELTNNYNAADMDGTGTGILFRQAYYDAVTPVVIDSVRIAAFAKTDWTLSSTRDACLSFSLMDGGTLTETLRISSHAENTAFRLFAFYDIWDDDNERASMGMVNHEYAQFGPFSTSTGGIHLIAARDSYAPIRLTGRSTTDSATYAGIILNLAKADGAGALTAYADTARLLSLDNNGSNKLAIFGNGDTEFSGNAFFPDDKKVSLGNTLAAPDAYWYVEGVTNIGHFKPAIPDSITPAAIGEFYYDASGYVRIRLT